MKLLVILISNITASKETSGSQIPCPMLGNITHAHTHPALFDSLIWFLWIIVFWICVKEISSGAGEETTNIECTDAWDHASDLL